MRTPRSYLFVPGQKPALFDKAAASGADAVILDLEDAVGPDQKDAARDSAVDWFQSGGESVAHNVIRINGIDTPWFADDIAALADSPCRTVMILKAAPDSLQKAAALLPGTSLIGLIETADGLAGLRDLSDIPGLSRLAFGNLDFGSDLRIPGVGSVLAPARFEIALASRLAGLPQPVDGVTTDLKDAAVLTQDIRAARDLGFSAKLCIHPAQVGPVNQQFTPSEADIAWARLVITTLAETKGSVAQIDGKMIDAPVVKRAEQILDCADT